MAVLAWLLLWAVEEEYPENCRCFHIFCLFWFHFQVTVSSTLYLFYSSLTCLFLNQGFKSTRIDQENKHPDFFWKDFNLPVEARLHFALLYIVLGSGCALCLSFMQAHEYFRSIEQISWRTLRNFNRFLKFRTINQVMGKQ